MVAGFSVDSIDPDGPSYGFVAAYLLQQARWTKLGAGFNGPVYALEVHHGELYAGGDFTIARAHGFFPEIQCRRVARWTGERWVEAGDGFNNNAVFALKSIRSGPPGNFTFRLAAGGSFTQTGSGATVQRFALLNHATGRWESSLACNNSVLALASQDYRGPYQWQLGVNPVSDGLMGGAFTTINSQTRTRVAYIDGGFFSFAGASASVFALLHMDHPVVASPPDFTTRRFIGIIGGAFGMFGGLARPMYALVEGEDLNVVPTRGFNLPVRALRAREPVDPNDFGMVSGDVYVGGQFTALENGVPMIGVARSSALGRLPGSDGNGDWRSVGEIVNASPLVEDIAFEPGPLGAVWIAGDFALDPANPQERTGIARGPAWQGLTRWGGGQTLHYYDFP